LFEFTVAVMCFIWMFEKQSSTKMNLNLVQWCWITLPYSVPHKQISTHWLSMFHKLKCA
jgi:hypothetical protein